MRRVDPPRRDRLGRHQRCRRHSRRRRAASRSCRHGAGERRPARGAGASARARVAVVADEASLSELATALLGTGIAAAAGPEALEAAAAEPVDWAMSAIVGAAGLAPRRRLRARRRARARQQGVPGLRRRPPSWRTRRQNMARALPVDSEHSAIFQVLEGRAPPTIEHLSSPPPAGRSATGRRTDGDGDAAAGACAPQLGDGREDLRSTAPR